MSDLRELLEDILEMSPEDFASHEVRKRIDAALAHRPEPVAWTASSLWRGK